MAKERHLPPGDIRRVEVASPMERQTPQEILLVEGNVKDNTPHIQFNFFLVNFYLLYLLSPKGRILFFLKNNFYYLCACLPQIRGVV